MQVHRHPLSRRWRRRRRWQWCSVGRITVLLSAHVRFGRRCYTKQSVLCFLPAKRQRGQTAGAVDLHERVKVMPALRADTNSKQRKVGGGGGDPALFGVQLHLASIGHRDAPKKTVRQLRQLPLVFGRFGWLQVLAQGFAEAVSTTAPGVRPLATMLACQGHRGQLQHDQRPHRTPACVRARSARVPSEARRARLALRARFVETQVSGDLRS